MKTKDITKTVEQVVRTIYVAEDGQEFNTEEECLKYETSALFAVSSKLKKLNTKYVSAYNLFEMGCEDEEIEIFDIQTNEELDNLRRYLYLKLTKNGVKDEYIQACFVHKEEKWKDFDFSNVTVGHEVLIFWSCDGDWFWVYKDGSLNGYFEYIREKYNEIISTDIKE